MPSWTRLRVGELREICDGMGISRDGKKQDLLKRLNEFTSQIDIVNDAPLSTCNTVTDNNPAFRDVLDQQDHDYFEGLRIDKIKSVERAIHQQNYESIKIDDLKIALESKHISYNNIFDKSELLKLFMSDAVSACDDDNESQLSRKELTAARLQFYSRQLKTYKRI